MGITTEQIASLSIFAATRIYAVKWVGLASLTVALLVGGINPAMSAFIQFDFFFNGKSESGSGMLEAIANKDGSLTAVLMQFSDAPFPSSLSTGACPSTGWTRR